MSFESIDEIVNQIKSSSDVAQTYVFNFESGAVPKSKLTASKNIPRRLILKLILGETAHYYCLAKHSVSEDALKCLGLKAQVTDLLLFAVQLLPGAWHVSKC